MLSSHGLENQLPDDFKVATHNVLDVRHYLGGACMCGVRPEELKQRVTCVTDWKDGMKVHCRLVVWVVLPLCGVDDLTYCMQAFLRVAGVVINVKVNVGHAREPISKGAIFSHIWWKQIGFD